MVGASQPASALDGCMVMLCLAAPSWREVPMCVPTIHELNKRLARGGRFPTCKDAGSANAAGNEWASAPDFCPPQYTRKVDGESGWYYTCDFTGAVTVMVNGQVFTRTWWNLAGDSRAISAGKSRTSIPRKLVSGISLPRYDSSRRRLISASISRICL